MTRIIKPRRLQPGDGIGLVSPSSPASPPEKIDRGADYFDKRGYRVKIGRHARAANGYLAGSDEERAGDFNAMVRDPEIRAIVAVRGGYGTPRLLDLINYGALVRDPKIIVGFSDLTALQLAVFAKTGLVTFSGPMAGVEFWQNPDPYTEENFWRMLTSSDPVGPLPHLPGQPLSALSPGLAEGRLLGGNLCLVTTLLGTPYQPDFADSLLFLEEVDEYSYRVDRMLTHLANAGILAKVAGMIFGQFTQCKPRFDNGDATVEEVISDRARRLQKPALGNLPYGHVPAKLTLPIGARARIDSGKGVVEILEGAVA